MIFLSTPIAPAVGQTSKLVDASVTNVIWHLLWLADILHYDVLFVKQRRERLENGLPEIQKLEKATPRPRVTIPTAVSSRTVLIYTRIYNIYILCECIIIIHI